MHSRKVVITHARRTPLGALGGALAGSGPVEIVGAECVAKSYPAFFDDLGAILA